jgi:hypothetical protein
MNDQSKIRLHYVETTHHVRAMNIAEVFEDRARSGGSIMGRDGLLRLLDRAK